MLDVAIVGGGLSGLSLASQLQSQGLKLNVFEARDRLGGRVLSKSTNNESLSKKFRFDLGPGWVWPNSQPYIAEFLERYNISYYSQWQQGLNVYMAEREIQPQAYHDENAYAGACRIEGGSYRLIEALLKELPPQVLHLNHQLLEVIDRQDHVELRFGIRETEINIKAQRVVLTIPPRLLDGNVTFTPALNKTLYSLMRNTPTWMAGHAKAIIRYTKPFWREANFSGNGFAIYQGAVLREIFDASSPDEQIAALSGFFGMSPNTRNRYADDIEPLLLDQLVRMYGPQAAKPEEIIYQDWSKEIFTASQEDQEPLTDHPQYGHHYFQLDHWNDKLFFGGTESAKDHGGYLEGALVSSARIAASLLL